MKIYKKGEKGDKWEDGKGLGAVETLKHRRKSNKIKNYSSKSFGEEQF